MSIVLRMGTVCFDLLLDSEKCKFDIKILMNIRGKSRVFLAGNQLYEL